MNTRDPQVDDYLARLRVWQRDTLERVPEVPLEFFRHLVTDDREGGWRTIRDRRRD